MTARKRPQARPSVRDYRGEGAAPENAPAGQPGAQDAFSSGCPICLRLTGDKHADGCAMWCRFCDSRAGEGHRPNCRPWDTYISPENVFLRRVIAKGRR